MNNNKSYRKKLVLLRAPIFKIHGTDLTIYGSYYTIVEYNDWFFSTLKFTDLSFLNIGPLNGFVNGF